MNSLRRAILRNAAIALALATVCARGAWTASDKRRPMTLVDLAELPRLLDPQLSPDGRTLVYLRSHADWKTSRVVWNLWRQDIGGGAPVALSSSEGGEAPGTRWSPDGKTLAILRGGQIHLLPVEGGEPHALTHHATGVSSPSWTPDGSAIYFLASDPRTSDERERERLQDDVYAFDENYKQRHLWKIVVATGVETPITSGDASVLSYRLSRDGTRIVLHRAPSPLAADDHRSEVWVMDADGTNARAITHNEVGESSAELSPDKSQVLFLSDTNERFEPYYNTNLFVAPVGGKTARPVIPDFKYAVDQAAWSSDGNSILAVVNMGVHSEVFRIDVRSGKYTQLTDGRHYIPPGTSLVHSAGQMVMQFDEPTRFGDAWLLSTTGDTNTPRRVTTLFDTLERDFILPRQEKVEWKSDDGTKIEGILFYPIGYEQGKRYPLVVQMHGGPMDSDKYGAGIGLVLNYFPVLASKGYFVLRPNYRGSSGYGNEFFRDVNNGYFHHMERDVLTGIDALVARGMVDPDRLVAMGWSAGGTLTNRLVTTTTRFKAASSYAGAADWLSLWGQTDNYAFRRTWFGGTPWEKGARADLFWNNSPIANAAAVRTPTLLFTGQSDARVPMSQSVEMYRALMSHNVPTHLYIAPREGHLWLEPRHLLFKANTELEWFEKYAMGRTHVWEKAP
jgi:dipeptidyl aminopeptidase/acylaminoacyl peptidase